jgi:fatty acid desaturase
MAGMSTAEAPTSTARVLPLLRQAAIKEDLLRPAGARGLIHVAGMVGAWAALVSIGFIVDSIFVWVPVWICIAFLFVGFGGLGHDCAHGSTFKSRWANSLLGHLVLGTAGVSFKVYRQYHLLHHADTLGPDDPDGPGMQFASRAEYALFHATLGAGFVGLTWWAALVGAFHRPPKWARTTTSKLALRGAWFPGVLVVGAYVYGSVVSDTFRHIWLYPWLFMLVPVLAFVLVGEHYAGRAEDGTLKNTYTVMSNPVTRFALYNVNFHTVHHMLPRIPGTSLRRMNELAAPYEENTYSGYLAFHHQLLAPLPWLPPRKAQVDLPHQRGQLADAVSSDRRSGHLS